ncbi:MAG: adenylosuccinate synthase [Pseudomonadota bacterium]
MKKNIIVLGTQWGDEGKGKIVDLLTPQVAAVVRFQGGHNAGHTLVIDGKKTILHLLPSGILHPHIKCYIGNGVVVSLPDLFAEINTLKANHVTVLDRLFISHYCPILLPSHIAIDKAREQKRGATAIGTTGRGIGPCYEDKVARRGLRMADLLDENFLSLRLKELLEYHNFLLTQRYQERPIDYQATLDELLEKKAFLQPMLTDVTASLAKHQAKQETILFEGAQGTLLDIDHGTYPYVTSSNTIAAAASVGTGFGLLNFDEIIGVTKAYTTRVGAGPFPTELLNDEGQYLANKGHEFGSTTGRPRRCGWFDSVALKRAVLINSINSLCLTKLDVLDGLKQINICISYKCDDKEVTTLSAGAKTFASYEPVYQTFPGWQETTLGIKDFTALPANAKNYLNAIEKIVGVPITMISTGPEREQMILRT